MKGSRRWQCAGMFGLVLFGGLAGCRHEPARVAQSGVAPGAPAGGSAGEVPESTGRDQMPSVIHEIPAGARQISIEVGMASWYGTVYNHQRAADGSVYEQEAMTAASRTLPLGVVARITNLSTGEVVVVKITDRGPFVQGRILDLSAGAARAVGLYRTGIGRVKVEAFRPPGMLEVPAKWCVQIGAFLDVEDARQLKNDLLRRYGSAKVVTFTGPTGSWVRLTPTGADREQSAAIAGEVRIPDPGVDAYVTRLN